MEVITIDKLDNFSWQNWKGLQQRGWLNLEGEVVSIRQLAEEYWKDFQGILVREDGKCVKRHDVLSVLEQTVYLNRGKSWSWKVRWKPDNGVISEHPVSERHAIFTYVLFKAYAFLLKVTCHIYKFSFNKLAVGLGERVGQQHLAKLREGAESLSMVSDRNVSENRPFIGLIPKHSLKDYAFSVTCLEVCQ